MDWLGEINSAIIAREYDSEQIRIMFVVLLGLVGF